MKIESVQSSYARWAPIYDKTFGVVTGPGRVRAIDFINGLDGTLLEVGVGTGLSLQDYKPSLHITGIDYSPDMLEKAKARVDRLGLKNVVALREMDARQMDFPDASFDTVAALHVLSVVPEPEKVMAEIARVLKPGGHVVITNHFVHKRGFLGFLERISAPFANILGWHSDFKLETVLQEPPLEVAERKSVPPLGMMTFLVLTKTDVTSDGAISARRSA